MKFLAGEEGQKNKEKKLSNFAKYKVKLKRLQLVKNLHRYWACWIRTKKK